MYRLKNKKLQEQLNKLSGGEFGKAISEGGRLLYDDSGYLRKVEFGPYVGRSVLTRRFALVFETSDIEEVPEYKPQEWNDFEKVIPPENELMRCEWIDEEGDLLRGCAKYLFDQEGNGWWIVSDEVGTMLKKVIRFRRWED